jgi:hypothetical protein
MAPVLATPEARRLTALLSRFGLEPALIVAGVLLSIFLYAIAFAGHS